jgi:hypothetical protein
MKKTLKKLKDQLTPFEWVYFLLGFFMAFFIGNIIIAMFF